MKEMLKDYLKANDTTQFDAYEICAKEVKTNDEVAYLVRQMSDKYEVFKSITSTEELSAILEKMESKVF